MRLFSYRHMGQKVRSYGMGLIVKLNYISLLTSQYFAPLSIFYFIVIYFVIYLFKKILLFHPFLSPCPDLSLTTKYRIFFIPQAAL